MIDKPLAPAACPPDDRERNEILGPFTLSWRAADALLPDARIERALVRKVEVRSAEVAVCAGRLVVTDPAFALRDRRGMPVEVVVASAVKPALGVALRREELVVAPPDGAWQVTRRDGFTAYGAWDLGAYSPPSSSFSR